MVESIVACTEHQGNDTPHIHGLLAVVTPYQYKSLLEIRDLITRDISEFDRIKRFIENMCREDHYDNDTHQASIDSIEQAKKDGLAGAVHIRLSSKPAFLQQCLPDESPSLWGHEKPDETRLRKDAMTYKSNFEKHTQFVFSHVQHHWHHEKDGVRTPHAYCRKTCMKTRKGLSIKKRCGEEICKQDFPKTRQLNLIPRIICP